MDDHESLRVLRQMFQASGWTQARLARALDISASDMNNILHGRRAFSLKVLRCAAKALGYRVSLTVAPTESGRRGPGGGK